MNEAQQELAYRLENAELGDLTSGSFRYPEEPKNAETQWQRTFAKGGLDMFKKWNDRLHNVFWLSLGLMAIGLVVASKVPGWVLLAIWGWTLLSTIFAFYSVSQMKVSVFDYFVWQAFKQAKGNPSPWLMVRWLGEAFHYVQHSPCRIKKLRIWQRSLGQMVPNHFDYIRHQLRMAAVHALRSFAPAQNRRDNMTAETRYNEILDDIHSLVPQLKNRWIAVAENLQWTMFVITALELWLFLGDR